MGTSRNNLVCEEESAAEGLVREFSVLGIRDQNPKPKERGGTYTLHDHKKEEIV